MHFRRCPSPTCGRTFQLNRFRKTASAAKQWGDITCPHCGLIIAGDGHSVFLTHPISADQEAAHAQRQRRVSGTPRVLLVEDDPCDIELTKAALDKSGIRHELALARDGREAMAALAPAGDAAPYSLVLLDLRLPEVDGLDVLKTIRSTPELAPTPVVVMSTSTEEADLHRAYSLNIDGYIVKPMDVQALSASLSTALSVTLAR
ncbi:response regulator [Oxalobacteraceae bacterium OM1]|nr:response regulator [Oxalobacteraceae bacterium OM1]